MRQKSQTRQTAADKTIKDIRRATRKQYSAEEKIRIVLDGLRGEETIAELCRCEGRTATARTTATINFLIFPSPCISPRAYNQTLPPLNPRRFIQKLFVHFGSKGDILASDFCR